MNETRNKKILYISLGVVAVSALLLIARHFIPTKPLLVNNLSNLPATSSTVTLDAASYKKAAAQAYAELSAEKIDDATAIKEKLLALKIPKDFKDLHLQLVVASASFEEYAKFHDSQVLARFRSLLASLIAKYPWLANPSS